MPQPKARRYQRGPHLVSRKRGDKVLYYAYVPGLQDKIALCTSDRDEAEKRFRELLSTPEIRPLAGPTAAEVDLAAIAEQYLEAPHGWTRQTLRTTRNRVIAFGCWFDKRGVRLASEITPEALDPWIGERRSETTHRTINRDLRSVKLMLRWATERSLCKPCAAIAERPYLREARRQNRAVVPDPPEMSRVLSILQEQHAGAHAAVCALYVTGLRIDELRRLTVFDLADHVVHVRPEQGAADSSEPTKGHRERTIPMAPEAETILRRFFAWTAGQKRTFSESWLIKRLHRASDAAKLPRFGLHDIRRAFATEAHRAGVKLLVISKWLGHADARTTELYLASYRSDRDVVAPVPSGLVPISSQSRPNLGVKLGPKRGTLGRGVSKNP